MIHLRIVAAPERAASAIAVLMGSESVSNVVHLPGCVSLPSGDLIMCDVPSDSASLLVEALRDSGIDVDGSISLEPIDTQITRDGLAAETSVQISDAVVWEEVESRTSQMTGLSITFLIFIVVAILIGVAGIVQRSSILIVGAMIVGPDFGPVAGTCVALVERRRQLAVRSVSSLMVGFVVGIGVSCVIVIVCHALGAFPAHLNESTHALPEAVANVVGDPNFYTVFVAFLAGVIGMLSLSTAKTGALIGVLVSVTTIPAASNVALAMAYQRWDTALGSLAQLAVNLTTLLVAATLTLAIQRAVYLRARAHQD
jgi:uncharacterized hydrophobic protein (TIGR00271 family)